LSVVTAASACSAVRKCSTGTISVRPRAIIILDPAKLAATTD
jgi:hypothetical protein